MAEASAASGHSNGDEATCGSAMANEDELLTKAVTSPVQHSPSGVQNDESQDSHKEFGDDTDESGACSDDCSESNTSRDFKKKERDEADENAIKEMTSTIEYSGRAPDKSADSGTKNDENSIPKQSNSEDISVNVDKVTAKESKDNKQKKLLAERNDAIVNIQRLDGTIKQLTDAGKEGDESEKMCTLADFQRQFLIKKTAFEGNLSETFEYARSNKYSYSASLKELPNSFRLIRQLNRPSLRNCRCKYEGKKSRFYMYKKPVRLLDKSWRKVAVFVPHLTLEEALDQSLLTAADAEQGPSSQKCKALMKRLKKCDEQKQEESSDDEKKQEESKAPATSIPYSFTDEKVENRDEVSTMSTEKTSSMKPSCDFCGGQAAFSCENCSYLYCEGCFCGLHPAVGPFLRHTVVPAVFTLTISRCEDHDLPCKLFCQVCQKDRCIDCCNTTCRLHFQSKATDQDVEKEKVNLLSMMEKLTSDINTLNVYDTQMDEEVIQIEMSALYRREQIRQEFVSFQELLINSEEALCKQLEQEVEESLQKVWRGQEEALTQLRKEETTLTSLSTDLLQTADRQQFIQGTAGIHESYRDIHSKIAGFHKAWARGSLQCQQSPAPLLRQPFSLYQEKKHLSDSIQHIAGQELKVEFLQKLVFVNSWQPLRLESRVFVSGLGPSTTVTYLLQLYCSDTGRQAVVWQTHTHSLQGVQLNTRETHMFTKGSRYLLKLQPTAVCHVSATRQQKTQYPAAHMVIVVS